MPGPLYFISVEAVKKEIAPFHKKLDIPRHMLAIFPNNMSLGTFSLCLQLTVHGSGEHPHSPWDASWWQGTLYKAVIEEEWPSYPGQELCPDTQTRGSAQTPRQGALPGQPGKDLCQATQARNSVQRPTQGALPIHPGKQLCPDTQTRGSARTPRQGACPDGGHSTPDPSEGPRQVGA